MSGRQRLSRSGRLPLRTVFAWPAIIALIGIIGLVSALTGDQWRDWLSWLSLGLPVAVFIWALGRRNS